MKNIFKTVAVAAITLFMVSCGTSSTNGPVYRAPDGTVYRSGDVYKDRNGNVYQNGRMISKNGTSYKKLPPGQAKKIYGGEATDYAPGQVKKRSNGYYDGHDHDHHNNGNDHHKDYKKNKNGKKKGK